VRRIIAFDHVSAGGYFATDEGKLDWVVPDEELAQSNLRNMAEADTILFGRRTYEMFESFWPERHQGSSRRGRSACEGTPFRIDPEDR
jgi:dihydrofolate reductase